MDWLIQEAGASAALRPQAEPGDEIQFSRTTLAAVVGMKTGASAHRLITEQVAS
jgi:hypothetical protein